MIKWAPFPFLRITLAFISGILLSFKFENTGYPILGCFLATLAAFILCFFGAKFRRSALLFSVAGITGLVCFVLAGWLLTEIRTEKNNPHHLLHRSGNVTHYSGYLNDFLLEKPTVFQTTLRLQKIRINGKWHPASGQIQLTFRKEPDLQKPKYGDELLIKGSPKLVKAPLNPGQFDYRKYLALRNVHHQQYLYPNQFETIGQRIENPVMAFSMHLRKNLDKILKVFVPSKREYGIASALVLGIKDELDNDIKTAYANTGTMHVLAVSGLHVTLVFQILSLGLKRLRSNRWNRLLSAAIILSVVWGFAFITALSPSVLRAAVMFTFIIGSQVLVKHTNIYNTLAVSAFALLCYNPFFLFDVGFQLSYIAVIAIVYLQPKIYELRTFNNWLADKIWLLLSVSLAAQIGTFPLSLYYFHQFPVYFLLSNLIAVPLSTAVLYAGLAVLATFWIPGVGFAFGKLMQFLLWLMNESMIFLEKWPLALINRIPFSGLEAICIYLFIFTVLLFAARPKLKYLTVACFLLAVSSFAHIRNAFAANARPKFIVHAVPKRSVWSFLAGNATLLADSAFLNNRQAVAFNLEPVLMNAGVGKVELQNWSDPRSETLAQHKTETFRLIRWRGLSILSLEKPLKADLKEPLEIDYLVLRKNVWTSPEKLQRNFRFKKLIFDSSNESWYVKWLGLQLAESGLPAYDVNTQGAFEVYL